MRQILISKSDQIEELAGSQINFKHKADEDGQTLTIYADTLTRISIPFRAKIMAGGKLDLDFKLPEKLASMGVSLLGAYWDGQAVTAYMRSCFNVVVGLEVGETILVGTLVQLVTYRQIDESIMSGMVNSTDQGDVLMITPKPSKSRQRKSKIKKED